MRATTSPHGGHPDLALLQQAAAALQAGRLNKAIGICRRILAKDTPHADEALHLLGAIAFQRQDYLSALEMFERAAQHARSARHIHAVAAVLGRLGRLEEAIAAFRTAIALDPPGAPKLHVDLGTALQRLGRLDEAAAAMRQAVLLIPSDAAIQLELGRILRRLGRLGEAVEVLRGVITLMPDGVAAHAELGLALGQLGRPAEASMSLRKAIELAPTHAELHADLGVALAEQGRNGAAIAAFTEAIRLRPELATAHANLGSALAALDRLPEALTACDKAIAIKPDHASAHANKGLVLLSLGRFEEAIAAFEKAIASEPDHPNARLNLALTLLLLGRFKPGWEAYEFRWQAARKRAEQRTFSQPKWRGEPLAGRTLLLHAEQGLGDAIQFVRYVPLIARADKADHLLLRVPPVLRRLMNGLPGVDQLCTTDEPLPSFDLHSSLLSLPHVFGTTLETIPAAVPYLRAEHPAVERWRDRLAGRGLRVGIAWAGNPNHKNDRNRSVVFQHLNPLWRVPGIKWVSLQLGQRRADLQGAPSGLILDAAPELHDLAETAAVITALDLIVTVDTAVAHLAGALGRPAWVMLPFVPDWRWMLRREDSPWYPTPRLCRQPQARDWGTVVENIASGLRLRAG